MKKTQKKVKVWAIQYQKEDCFEETIGLIDGLEILGKNWINTVRIFPTEANAVKAWKFIYAKGRKYYKVVPCEIILLK